MNVFLCLLLTISPALAADALPKTNFDFKGNGPFELLGHLIRQGERGVKWVTIPNAPDEWITEDHVKLLVLLLDSDEPCASVVPERSSIIPGLSGEPAKSSTIGHEAAYLMESYRQKLLYPSSVRLSSIVQLNPESLRRWWADTLKD